MTLIARQQSAGGHEPVFRSHSRACAALESGGPWKASRRDETSFFATASKKPVDLAAWATKPGQGSLDGTLSHAAWKCVPRCVEFCTGEFWFISCSPVSKNGLYTTYDPRRGPRGQRRRLGHPFHGSASNLTLERVPPNRLTVRTAEAGVSRG